MSENTVPLSLRAVQRTFLQGDRRLEVLRAISLDLRAGEIVALVGQSGSGKSTLLHIAGLLDTQAEAVGAAYTQRGLTLKESGSGEWPVLVLQQR